MSVKRAKKPKKKLKKGKKPKPKTAGRKKSARKKVEKKKPTKKKKRARKKAPESGPKKEKVKVKPGEDEVPQERFSNWGKLTIRKQKEVTKNAKKKKVNAKKSSVKHSVKNKVKARKIEKPKLSEGASLLIETVADRMIKVAEFKGEVPLSDFKGEPDIIEAIAEILDENKVIELVFPKSPLASPFIRKVSSENFVMKEVKE